MSAQKARLGQNFLADHSAARRIVEELGDVSGSLVLEIGPGQGALTDALAEKAGHLIAIELDRTLAAGLRVKFASNPSVEIVEGDILAIDLPDILARTLPHDGNAAWLRRGAARVVGNLPYYITSDILLRLFEFHQEFELLVIMVQREVADRIAARPGTRDYGLLSATCQLYARVENLFSVPPGAFVPPPKVYSSVLRLRMAPRFLELGVRADEFIDFLKLAFAMKRKTLLNNLRKRYQDSQIHAALKQAGVRLDVRAEAMALEEAAAVFKQLTAGQGAAS